MAKRRINWKVIRLAFERDNVTNISELSRKFGVSREAITDHRDAEKWQPAPHVASKVSDKVVDILTKRAVDALPTDIGSQIAEDLAAHAELSRMLVQAGKLILQEFVDGKIKPGPNQNRADVFNAIASGMKRATDLGRDIHGVRPGVASTHTADAEEKRIDKPVYIVRTRESEAKHA